MPSGSSGSPPGDTVAATLIGPPGTRRAVAVDQETLGLPSSGRPAGSGVRSSSGRPPADGVHQSSGIVQDVAAPRHVLVGTHQDQRGTEQVEQAGIRQVEAQERQPGGGGRPHQRLGVGRGRPEPQQREAGPQQVVEAPALVEPRVRGQMSRSRGRYVGAHGVRRRRRAVRDDDRGALVPVPELDPETGELPGLVPKGHRGHLAGAITVAPRVLEPGQRGPFRTAREVVRRLVDHPLVHRPPLGLVAVEQRPAAPTLHRRRQLPAQVDGVADAHVHPVAAGRGMQVRRVTEEEHPPAAVAARQQPLRGPGAVGHHLAGELRADGPVEVRADLVLGHPPVAAPDEVEPPGVDAVEGTQDGLEVVVHRPVLDGGSLVVDRPERRSVEHGGDVVGEHVVAVHADVQLPAHGGACPVAAREIAAPVAESGPRGRLGGLHQDVLAGVRDPLGRHAGPPGDVREAHGPLAQHPLQGVLGDLLRGLGVGTLPVGCRRHRVREPDELPPGHAGDEGDVGGERRRKWRRGPHRVREPPPPQQRHGADVGQFRLRLWCARGPSFEHLARDPATAELDGERGADRPTPDDQHVDVALFGFIAHGCLAPRSCTAARSAAALSTRQARRKV